MKTTHMIRGYASVFNIQDITKDVVMKGAFRHTLRSWKFHNQWPKMLWQHDVKEPIGLWKNISENERGLYVQGELNLETQRGTETLALLRQGAIDGLSIGFRPLKKRWNPQTQCRELLDIDLIEISLVTLGANPLARLHSA